jgi:hypothetical protein
VGTPPTLTPGGLIGPNVKLLRDELHQRFHARPAQQHAIDSVLDALDDGWEYHHQGLETADLDTLNRELLPTLETLRTVHPASADAFVNALLLEWRRLGPVLRWLP